MKTFITKLFLAMIFLGLLTGTASAKILGVQYQDTKPVSSASRGELDLEEIIGRGFPVTSNFPTDIAKVDLKSIVGRGFISKLTPDEIENIDAQGFLPSADQIASMVSNLVEITIKGVKIVIDKTNFSQTELATVVNSWEDFLATI